MNHQNRKLQNIEYSEQNEVPSGKENGRSDLRGFAAVAELAEEFEDSLAVDAVVVAAPDAEPEGDAAPHRRPAVTELQQIQMPTSLSIHNCRFLLMLRRGCPQHQV